MNGERMPIAAWRVTLDGKDLTDTFAPLLLSVSISEKRGGEADQLDITVMDKGGKVAIPPKGAVLSVAMGWRQGAGLPIGLIDKGTFTVDEASFRGPPDIITIRARSADFTDSFRVRRERSFVGKTVADIVGDIATANGLKLSVDATLGAKTVPALGHGSKSDAALLAALGRRFDAAATVKAGTLIFAPIGKGKTASGKTLPTVTLKRSDSDTVDYSRVERDSYDGAEASYHDKASGEQRTVTAGRSGGGTRKPKRIRKVHASEADAQQAADAEASRTDRAKAKATIRLALGRPDIIPEQPTSLTKWKAEIDAHKWIVAEATHTMDGQGGLATTLQLEAIG